MTEISYIAIIVAAVAQFVLGAVWYSPLLFGKSWMKIMGADQLSPEALKAMQKAMAPFYGLQLGLTLWSTFALAQLALAVPLGIVHLAFWILIGFIIPVQIGAVIWASTPKCFWLRQLAIMISYQTVAFLGAAYLLTLW